MADETSRVAQWLYELLSGDVTLSALIGGVFEQPAPLVASHPLVCFYMVSAADVTTGDSLTRIFSHQVWSVFAVVDSPSFTNAIPIMDRVDLLLDEASGSADGCTIYKATRESSIRYVEEIDGRQFRHLGGDYRILAQII